MARIRNNPDGLKDRVIVEFEPSEIIHKPLYVQIVDEVRPEYIGHTVGDTIRNVAWRSLNLLAPKVVGDRKFQYSGVDVVEGRFVITFFEGMPKVSAAPPNGANKDE